MEPFTIILLSAAFTVVLVVVSLVLITLRIEAQGMRAAKNEAARNLRARDAERFTASEAAQARHPDRPGPRAASTPTNGRPSACC